MKSVEMAHCHTHISTMLRSKWFRRKSENSKQSIPILILSIHNPIQLCRRAKRHQSQTNKVSTVGLFVSALCFAALTALYLHLASESLRQKDKKTTGQKDTKTKRKDQKESLSGQGPRTIWHQDNLAPRTIWHRPCWRTIWHHSVKVDNLAPRTIWHRGQFGTMDNLAP